MSIHRDHRRQASQGFTLVEVLIGLIILAIGLLSMAGLQTMAKKANFEAVQRTTAIMLAQDIIERMRGNAADATVLSSYVSSYVDVAMPAGLSACYDSTNPCTPEQLVARDLYEWQRAIVGASDSGSGGGLYMPSACITQTVLEVNTPPIPDTIEYTVAIAWRGRSALTNPVAHPCGQGSGLYDDDETGAADVYRRLVSINFYAKPGF